MAKNVKIIPLGGLGEVGKNMTAIEYGRNLIVVDCGVMFPSNDMHGIDYVLPDFQYVIDNQDILRGIVLTHGHQDHIGSLPYLLDKISAPIYGTGLTIGMVEMTLQEKNLLHKTTLEVIHDQQTFPLGPFRISPFSVAHSIPAAVGLVIDTPVGAIVHTGDYKLDETVAGGYRTDFKRLAELTPNGVLALLGDSTNADRPGQTPTEKVVAETMDQLFGEHTNGRIIIATFSSMLARIQEIFNLADKHGRKVAVTGRSLIQNVELARTLGYLYVPSGLLVDVTDRHIADDKLIIVCTGSQGETRSALNRMANGDHRFVDIKKNDTVIVSGSVIPGNEEDVARMINNLFLRGANVIYGSLAQVHVSGHGSRKDMQTMLEKVNPKFLLPMHGEHRHLHLHGQMAQQNGMNASDIFVLHNGAVWVSDGEKAWVEKPLRNEAIYVDGTLIGEIGEVVMRDRERLAQDGFMVVYVPINRRTKQVGKPRIFSRGFLQMDSAQDLMEMATKQLQRELNRNKRNHHDTVRHTLENFFYHKTQSRPVILPHVVEV
ncbi:MAG TPA: ribonuclease J [Anaerolineae bacterium]|nr:ribonuclease J [Anaerolineae bacterium]